MKHGLLAADLVVRDEDPDEFARVLENLADELQPQGPLEELLVERVAVCMWRLRRLYGIEVGIFHYEITSIESYNADTTRFGKEKAVTLGAAFRGDA